MSFFLGIKVQCASKIKPSFFGSCFYSVIAQTIIAIFTLTMALILSGN